ncbi:MAG: hypothetical protein NTY22_06920 [Proteobacteria bacterium]|nr:hypothetical protein [Pseudomonadota bacterium]
MKSFTSGDGLFDRPIPFLIMMITVNVLLITAMRLLFLFLA